VTFLFRFFPPKFSEPDRAPIFLRRLCHLGPARKLPQTAKKRKQKHQKADHKAVKGLCSARFLIS
jgi:hypothetical protein